VCGIVIVASWRKQALPQQWKQILITGLFIIFYFMSYQSFNVKHWLKILLHSRRLKNILCDSFRVCGFVLNVNYSNVFFVISIGFEIQSIL